MTCDTAVPDDAGFTLIELLVTIALLSLLLVLLFGGLHFGTRAWDRAQAHEAGTDELRAVQDLMRRELVQAYPGHAGVEPAVAFDGGTDSVRFLAPAPQAVETGGRFRITIAERRGTLAMDGTPELAVAPGAAWSTVLLHHIAAVRLAYFSRGRWLSSWRDAAGLPELVRVQVDFPPGDGRLWPDLIVAPRIASGAGDGP